MFRSLRYIGSAIKEQFINEHPVFSLDARLLMQLYKRNALVQHV